MTPIARSILAATVLLAPASARADVAADTFGVADGYSTSSFATFGGVSSGGQLAVRIVPSTSAVIDRVEAAMSSPGGGIPVTISIFAESSGTPGGVAVWTSTTQTVVVGPGIVTFTGSTTTLTGGQAYWVSAYAPGAPAGALRWHRGLPGVSGSTATGPSPWSVVQSQVLPALRAGTAAPTGACCNTGANGLTGPGSGGCAVVTSTACAYLGLRFDGAGTTCSPTSCRACPADFNRSGTINVQDIFDFLNTWFIGCP